MVPVSGAVGAFGKATNQMPPRAVHAVSSLTLICNKHVPLAYAFSGSYRLLKMHSTKRVFVYLEFSVHNVPFGG